MIHYSLIVLIFALLSLSQGVYAQEKSSVELSSSVFVDVSGAPWQICAIEISGALICAQIPSASRLVPPETIPALTDVEVGFTHACGLTESGTVVCWGDNDFGQLDSPESVQFTRIKSGLSHSCGITLGGTVECWGLNDLNQSTPPSESLTNPDSQEPVTFVALDLAESISCGLDTEGYIHCWGESDPYNSSEQSFADTEAGITAVKFAIDSDRNNGGNRSRDPGDPKWNICVLLSNGHIECVEDQYQFDGQYMDIAGTDEMICGLTLEGSLDCQKTPYLEGESGLVNTWIDEINAREPLVRIDGGARLCGITASGSLQCIGLSGYPLPGEVPSVFPAPEDLRAAVYSDTTVELFWTGSRPAWEIAKVEIYRDGELLVQTEPSNSYLDTSLESGRDYTYRVRYLSVSGLPSAFSEAILVNTFNRGPQNPQGAGYTPVARPYEVQNLQALVYGPNLLELIWDRPSRSDLGFEIRREGEFIAYVVGVSHMDPLVVPGKDYVYEVITVDENGVMLGVAMTKAAVR